MAWEWVAPVATAAGVSLGAVTTWLTARGGRAHAETVAQESNRHAEQMAATDRLQKRLADAYIDLLQMVERSGHWASRIYPMMDTDPPRPVPDLPSADEQIRIRALVRAYGSDEVNKLLGEYVDIINDMLTMAGIIAEEQADRSVPNPAGRKLELDSRFRIQKELRPSELATRKQIGEQVSRELRGMGLPDPLIDLLRAHRKHQDEERAAACDLWEDTGYVFTSPTGQPLNPRSDYTNWKLLLERAEVPERRLHDARHTAATVLLLLGVTERTVMAVMGWSSTAMAARYQHVVAAVRRDVAVQVGGLLWRPPSAGEGPPPAA